MAESINFSEFGPEGLPKVEERDWRHLFTEEQLKKGESKELQKDISDFYAYLGGSCTAHFGSGAVVRRSGRRNSFQMSGNTVEIGRAPRAFTDTWDSAFMRCTCREADSGNGRCEHMAAAMIRWEKEHGPWVVKETDYEWRRRIIKLKREKEKERRADLLRKKEKEIFPALDFFGKQDEEDQILIFDLVAALKGFKTNQYYMDRARILLKEPDFRKIQVSIDKDRFGRQSLSASVYYSTELESGYVSCGLTPTEISWIKDDVTMDDYRRSWLYREEEEKPPEGRTLDEFELALLWKVWEYLEQQEMGEQTDEAALQFFRNLEKSEAVVKKSEAKPKEKQKILVISPRIAVEDGEAKVSFKLGKRGGKQIVLRNLREFVGAYEREGELELSKTETVDFSQQDIAEESAGWLQFIQRRVREIGDVNEKLSRRNFGYGSAHIGVNYQQELKGSLLDHFYDTGEGQTCEYQDKTNNVKNTTISIGHKDIRLRLAVERLSDARGHFAGVAVSGYLPVLIYGGSAQYILNPERLSRISEDEENAILPFSTVADASGYFRFQVGLQHLNEFYYRVLPRLMDNPRVEVTDSCAEEAAGYLPPEAVFTFYMDYESQILSCRAAVSYEDNTFYVNPYQKEEGTYRDQEQEKRVTKALTRWFPKIDSEKNAFWTEAGEDEMFQFLMEGIPELSRFGTVKGTDAFRSSRIRQIPKVQIGVSVKSGIMDLSVTSREVDEKELLALLDSYTRKKKYYRLKNGDFVDLSDDSDFQSTLDFLTGMDLIPRDVIKKKAHIPMYRALYLDRMLEEHDNVVSSRDRTFRALIKNFRTVADSDFELPESLVDTMRPYQTYGFKWLKTLAGAGFGGILADEMGLGKTLQTIALFLSEKEEGSRKPSLVVCPASLVYNWKEELARFAPALSVTVLGGSAGERKKILEMLKSGQGSGGTEEEQPAVPEKTGSARGRKKKKEALQPSAADVYITSYDLLKRDIVLYEEISFRFCVLDEAQFVKNQRAAVAKAVKAVNAEERLALTGTPIENRLSELWSIFDFLMPGFLYSSEEFIRRFEGPIAKEKDEQATLRLKQMTAPFILRRKKTDVLKDLPAKLEEVRYTGFEGEQQKLYDSQVIRMKKMLSESSGSGTDKIKILAELTRLRQVCCDPSLVYEDYNGGSAKRDACMQLVHTAMDGGHRMLIFSQFTSMLALLEADLEKEGIPFFKITGQTPKDKRIALVNEFNEGDTPVFLISLKAGGTGLNLTGADVVIHYDPWWNLAAQNQATDRAHRIGQTRQVTVYRIILKDTIEERILELQEAKMDLAEAILEGRNESLMSMTNEELLALLD